MLLIMAYWVVIAGMLQRWFSSKRSFRIKPDYRSISVVLTLSGITYPASYAMELVLKISVSHPYPHPVGYRNLAVLSNCGNEVHNFASCTLILAILLAVHQEVRTALRPRDLNGWMWNRFFMNSTVLLLFILESIPFVISVYGTLRSTRLASLEDGTQITFLISKIFNVLVLAYLWSLTRIAEKWRIHSPPFALRFVPPMMLTTSVITAVVGGFLAEGTVSVKVAGRLDLTYRVFQGLGEFVAFVCSVLLCLD
ncbi:hypothetical protein JAAARDRAFT_220894 [Jaapia argillacea MUCL 33604]|uniref:Uncharacterized protein n=1 Tax=Jaapia argillacea MUCL 33604 TaxID=933084 RepID=A0A067QB24_9AGAM|nr:hypothetical protein JAAARDRAFT_220894 [Jaapia argillacea MUCL 33604]